MAMVSNETYRKTAEYLNNIKSEAYRFLSEIEIIKIEVILILNGNNSDNK